MLRNRWFPKLILKVTSRFFSFSRITIESSPLDNSLELSNRIIRSYYHFNQAWRKLYRPASLDPKEILIIFDPLIRPRDGFEEIKDVAAYKGDFDPARLFRQRKSSIYVLVLPRRYLGHFPIMRLEACERGMRNNVSAPRLTAGLKRTLRNQKTTSRPFYRGEWMEQDRNRLFFLFPLLLLSFSFSRFATRCSPGFFSFPLPSPRKKWIVYKITRENFRRFDINWIDDGFLWKEEIVWNFNVLGCLFGWQSLYLSGEVQKNVRRKSFRLVI